MIDHLGSNQEPLLPEALNQRIRDAAEEYKDAGQIPRLALYDLAFPSSEKELAQLNQQAVILVTAVSQDGKELPLSRVYVTDGKTEIELQKLSELLSEVQSATVAMTFGRHRQDSLYLLPAYLTVSNRPLFVDFAINRKGFKLGVLEPPPAGHGASSAKPSRGKVASAEALTRLIEREYPGLLAK